jgi:hypothetical protein
MLEQKPFIVWGTVAPFSCQRSVILLQECGEHGFKLFSPPEAEDRGSHINICHEQGYAIVQVWPLFK